MRDLMGTITTTAGKNEDVYLVTEKFGYYLTNGKGKTYEWFVTKKSALMYCRDRFRLNI
jgi:hypothetical protein